jgi:hypothetical protein
MRVSILLPHHVETSALIVRQLSFQCIMTMEAAIEEEEDATIGTSTTSTTTSAVPALPDPKEEEETGGPVGTTTTAAVTSRRRRAMIEQPVVSSARTSKDAAAVLVVVIGVQANAAKAMWSVLEPLLFHTVTSSSNTRSSARIAAATVLWLLEWAFVAGATAITATTATNSNSSYCCCYAIDTDDEMFDLLFSSNQQQNTMPPPPAGSTSRTRRPQQQQRPVVVVQKRRLKFRVAETTRYLLEQQQSLVDDGWWSRVQNCCRVCLLLQPYGGTRLEHALTGRLIRWEHQLIRAQSLNGYVSTLGGGFFLCHHFATAIYLARHQQRLAVYLHRPDLYWTCWIHMAYSHVYAGHFRTARRILTAVERAIRVIVVGAADRDTGNNNHHNNKNDSDDDNKYSTLLAMCQSAQLHWKRMKQTAVATSSHHHSKRGSTTNMDDFVRVRVVGDQSKQNDLTGTHSLLQRY